MIDQDSGTVIALSEAQLYVSEFRKKFPQEIKALFVGENKINQILSQPDCIGIRIYNGFNIAENRLSHVLVGVNANGQDMADGIIVDRMVPCPTMCDSSSPLY